MDIRCAVHTLLAGHKSTRWHYHLVRLQYQRSSAFICGFKEIGGHSSPYKTAQIGEICGYIISAAPRLCVRWLSSLGSGFAPRRHAGHGEDSGASFCLCG